MGEGADYQDKMTEIQQNVTTEILKPNLQPRKMQKSGFNSRNNYRMKERANVLRSNFIG